MYVVLILRRLGDRRLVLDKQDPHVSLAAAQCGAARRSWGCSMGPDEADINEQVRLEYE